MASGGSDLDSFDLQAFSSIDLRESSSNTGVVILNSEFTTQISGINVSTQRQDITKVIADCVVSAVDKNISLCGGVSRQIAKAAGKKVKEECADYVQRYSCLPVSKVFVSSGGGLWKNILHACGPRWKDYVDKDQCLQLLTDTLYNCFIEASQLGHNSMAVPAVSSGSFLVPTSESAKCYLRAITKFDKANIKNKVRNILFVDVDEEKVSELHVQLQENASIKENETLRIVLMGKTGDGKSETGNTILSHTGCSHTGSFEVSSAWRSKTAVSSMEKTIYGGYAIEVVDTPGLFDEIGEKEDKQAHDDRMMKEILKVIIFGLPGPHVFCLFFRADTRYTRAEVEVYQQLEALFQVELKKFLMVVLTHSPVEGEYSLDAILKDPNTPSSFTNLLADVQRRVVGIDNRGPHAKQQVGALLDMAINIKNQNSAAGTTFYTNSLVSRCLQLLQSGEFAEKSLSDIKEEVRRQSDSEAVTRVLQDRTIRQQTKKSQDNGCIIL